MCRGRHLHNLSGAASKIWLAKLLFLHTKPIIRPIPCNNNCQDKLLKRIWSATFKDDPRIMIRHSDLPKPIQFNWSFATYESYIQSKSNTVQLIFSRAPQSMQFTERLGLKQAPTGCSVCCWCVGLERWRWSMKRCSVGAQVVVVLF